MSHVLNICQESHCKQMKILQMYRNVQIILNDIKIKTQNEFNERSHNSIVKSQM